jgi:predicted metal-dependent hydrolase
MLFRRSPPRVQAPRLTHGQLVEVAGLSLRLNVNARARRISLRLDTARREVVLTAPSARRLSDAIAFAATRTAWIADRLAELPPVLALAPGALIPLEGRPCRLERAAMRIAPSIKPASGEEIARLIAYGEGAAYARAVVRALRGQALARLGERTAHHCAALGVRAPAIALQDARTRWGSCRKAGAGRDASIRYNWRLVLAPPHVLDYVAAHECAHLIEANHGSRFWGIVKATYGDPKAAQSWLKTHGSELHSIS